MTELLQYNKEFEVHVYDTGPDGRLSLASLFNYLQDAAWDHAEHLGFGRNDLLKDNRFWALSRMYAEIDHLPLWKDTVIVRTWPSGTDKLFALRNYEVSYADGRHIANVTSSWLILDQATRKVQRPENALSHFRRNFEQLDSPLRYASKLVFENIDTVTTPAFKVKISDLDVNLHTNNVIYLKWVNDIYDFDFVMKNIPQSVEINYLSESLLNDEVSIQTGNDKNNGQFYNHSIFRSSDRREICKIRIGWIEK
jgi:medium-chain acyl-[acyl-carrier-protein] hydrolase